MTLYSQPRIDKNKRGACEMGGPVSSVVQRGVGDGVTGYRHVIDEPGS